jgi:hypothetical protein
MGDGISPVKASHFFCEEGGVQADQIGLIFAFYAIVYILCPFFSITKVSHIIRLHFSTEKKLCTDFD